MQTQLLKTFKFLTAAIVDGRKLLMPIMVCGMATAVVACGSGSDKTTPAEASSGASAGESTETGTGGTTTTAANGNCAVTNLATLEPLSSNVSASAGACSPKLPYVVFSALPTSATGDANKMYSVSLFDFDYCAYSAQYNFWPRNAFSVVSVSIVDPNATSGQAPRGGTYNFGDPTSGSYLYTSGPISHDSQWSFLGTGATTTTEATGTTICSKTASAVVSGSVTVTSGMENIAGANGNFIAGVIGSLSLTLDNGQVISGNFNTGACSPAYTPVSDNVEISPCSCSLATPI